MRVEIRKHSSCIPCITQHDYTHCHNQVANTVLQFWLSNVDSQQENQHIVTNIRHNPCCRTHTLYYDGSRKMLEIFKTYIWCWMGFFSRNSCRLWRNVEKYCTAGHTTDDNMAHAGHLRLQIHTKNL